MYSALYTNKIVGCVICLEIRQNFLATQRTAYATLGGRCFAYYFHLVNPVLTAIASAPLQLVGQEVFLYVKIAHKAIVTLHFMVSRTNGL